MAFQIKKNVNILKITEKCGRASVLIELLGIRHETLWELED